MDSLVCGMTFIFTLDIISGEREPNCRPVIWNSKIETLKDTKGLKENDFLGLAVYPVCHLFPSIFEAVVMIAWFFLRGGKI